MDSMENVILSTKISQRGAPRIGYSLHLFSFHPEKPYFFPENAGGIRLFPAPPNFASFSRDSATADRAAGISSRPGPAETSGASSEKIRQIAVLDVIKVR